MQDVVKAFQVLFYEDLFFFLLCFYLGSFISHYNQPVLSFCEVLSLTCSIIAVILSVFLI